MRTGTIAVGQLHEQAALGILAGVIGGKDLLADLGRIDLRFGQFITLTSPLLGVLLGGGQFALGGELVVGQQRVDLLQGPLVGPVIAPIERFAGVIRRIGTGVGRGIPEGVQIPSVAQVDRVAAFIAVRVAAGSKASAENMAVACSGW